MDQQPLPFFPEFLPDETLWSRVSRYHILTGNTGEDTTFRELFGKHEVLEQIVPAAAILALASRLPGRLEDITAKLVQENTLLPAFSPFLGHDGPQVEQGIPLGQHYDGLGRIPKRVVGEYGSAHRLCLSCLREDIALHGTGYWHRCHQVPGVRACWKHGEALITNCPVCRRPVSRRKALLSLPWKPCRCGWTPADHARPDAAMEAEKRFAEFACDLIAKDLPPIKPSLLRDGYIAKLRKIGFAHGERDIASNALREALEAEYGTEFISEIDPAYANGLRQMWIRFVPVDGQLEMPIMRFILLTMYLFGGADDFAGHMARTPVPSGAPSRGRARTAPASAPPVVDERKLAEMRGKVQRLQAQCKKLTLDDLWKQAYRVAEWLYENDKAWLISALRDRTAAEILAAKAADDNYKAEDMALAKRIDEGVDALYNAKGKPKRVTKTVIIRLTGKKLQYTESNRVRFPLSHGRLDRHLESYWHFSVRRFLYGVAEIRRLQETAVARNVQRFSGLHWHATNAMIAHFGWNVEIMVAAPYDLNGELARTGISRQWTGPDNIGDLPYGGRRYKKQESSWAPEFSFKAGLDQKQLP